MKKKILNVIEDGNEDLHILFQTIINDDIEKSVRESAEFLSDMINITEKDIKDISKELNVGSCWFKEEYFFDITEIKIDG